MSILLFLVQYVSMTPSNLKHFKPQPWSSCINNIIHPPMLQTKTYRFNALNPMEMVVSSF